MGIASFSRRTAPVFCLLLCAVARAFAQDAPPNAPPYPAADTYDAYVQYVHNVVGLSKANPSEWFFWEPFRGLIEARRYEGVYQLAKALHDTAAELSYCLGGAQFVNPVNLAYEAGQFDLVNRLIALDSRLARMQDQFSESSGLEPLATAVVHGDMRWAQAFLDAGADIDTRYVKSSRNGTYPANLLTVSPSKEMDAFLLSKHILTLFVLPSPQDGSCTDDNVRLRSDPGLQGKVIGKLMKGEAFEVLATTYKRETIDSVEGCWVKISFKTLTGWVFQSFVRCDYFDYP